MIKTVLSFVLSLALFAQTPWSPSAIQFKANQTGSTSTTVQKRLDQVILLYDYLSESERADVMLRTASLNCTTNFAKAVAVANHGTLILPKGRIKAQADLSNLNITVIGQGVDPIYGTCLINPTTNAPAIKVFFTAGWHYNVLLHNFCVYGSNSGSNTDTGIEINSMGHVELNNLYVAQCGSHGVVLGNIKHTTQIKIEGCTFQSNFGAGLYGHTDPQNSKQVNAVTVIDSTFTQGHGHGIDLWANQAVVRNCTIQGNEGAGIYMSGSDLGAANSSSITGYKITENYFELNKLGNIVGYCEYNATGPIIHYNTNLIIDSNYHLQTITAAPGTTASIMLNANIVGAYKGLKIKDNPPTLTGVGHVDLFSRHDARSVIELQQRDSAVGAWYSTYYLNMGTATVLQGCSLERTSVGPEYTSAHYLGQRSIDSVYNVQQEAISVGSAGADWKPLSERVSAAAPTNYVWQRNAFIRNSASASGATEGWVCTATGGATSTTRADSTAYNTVGIQALWSTGTTVWKVTVAGTSAGSAPSITGKTVGQTVVDGGVTWEKMADTQATFSAKAVLP